MKYYTVTERAWDGGDRDVYHTYKFRTKEEAEKVANRRTKNNWYKTGDVKEAEFEFDDANAIVKAYEKVDEKWK